MITQKKKLSDWSVAHSFDLYLTDVQVANKLLLFKMENTY